MKKLILLFAVTCLSLSSFSITTIYVKSDGSGTADGLSWANAVTLDQGRTLANYYNTLAIPVANQIWMKAGTYNLTAAFLINIPLTIYGGFAGAEANLTDRNWVINQTILNQTAALQVIWSNVEKDVLLDGLILQGGNPPGNGACGQITSGTTLRNCIIRNNKAVTVAKFAVFLTNVPAGATKKITLDNCLIVNNETAVSPSVFNIVTTSQVDITNTTIANNFSQATNATGAVIAITNGAPIVNMYNNIIYNNKTGSATAQSVTTTTMTTGAKVVYNNAWDVATANTTATAGNIVLAYSPFVSATGFVGAANASTQLLTDINAANFKLATGSTCINTGNNTYATATTDLAGDTRIQNTTVDMGAYEFSTTAGISYQTIENPIRAFNNQLVVPDHFINRTLSIYNIQGQLVQVIKKATTLNSLNTKGILLLKVDNETYKFFN